MTILMKRMYSVKYNGTNGTIVPLKKHKENDMKKKKQIKILEEELSNIGYRLNVSLEIKSELEEEIEVLTVENKKLTSALKGSIVIVEDIRRRFLSHLFDNTEDMLEFLQNG